MSRTEQMQALDRLAATADAWDYNTATGESRAQVGDYELRVTKVQHGGTGNSALERGHVNALWSVRHARYGELIRPTPALVTTYAKRDAVDYVRAHILHEPELHEA